MQPVYWRHVFDSQRGSNEPDVPELRGRQLFHGVRGAQQRDMQFLPFRVVLERRGQHRVCSVQCWHVLDDTIHYLYNLRGGDVRAGPAEQRMLHLLCRVFLERVGQQLHGVRDRPVQPLQPERQLQRVQGRHVLVLRGEQLSVVRSWQVQAL